MKIKKLEEIRARIPQIKYTDMSRHEQDRADMIRALDRLLDSADDKELGRPHETDRPEDWMLDPDDVRDTITDGLEAGA
ncbi:hypothetical protein SEA_DANIELLEIGNACE_96 [Arthrobacter phage DanielleIgnace]|nr:hypothetical protein SEA_DANIELLEIGNACE_96 [Arthrobacter phage DanielleIgnace]